MCIYNCIYIYMYRNDMMLYMMLHMYDNCICFNVCEHVQKQQHIYVQTCMLVIVGWPLPTLPTRPASRPHVLPFSRRAWISAWSFCRACSTLAAHSSSCCCASRSSRSCESIRIDQGPAQRPPDGLLDRLHVWVLPQENIQHKL